MNNTTTLEQALKILVKELDKVDVRKYTCTNNWGYSQLERDIVEKITNWQKEQDEAEYKTLSVDELLIEREKIEALILAKDKMALINYELKQLNIDEHPKSYLTDLEAKYKTLLESHNELLKGIKEINEVSNGIGVLNQTWLREFCQELINKAKNI